MIVKLITDRHWEFLSVKGYCIGLSESTRQNATLLEITYHGSNVTCSSIISAEKFCFPRHQRALEHVVLSSVLWTQVQSFFTTLMPSTGDTFLK